MAVIYANNASGKIGAAVATTDLTITLQNGNGSSFPSPSGGDYFPLTLVKSDGTFEIVKCTARVGDALTVVRSQEGTVAKAFAVGDRVSLRMTAGSMTDFKADRQPLSNLLTALASATSAANKFPYYTGPNAVALADITPFARTFLDDADAASVLATLGALASAMLVGSVQAFAMTTPPSGFLKCNGQLVSRVTYSALFAAIGTTYGAGDGSTTFNLPDLRGEFIRGLDDGRGVDDSRGIGTAQTGQNLAHSHTASTATSGNHGHTTHGHISASQFQVSGGGGYGGVGTPYSADSGAMVVAGGDHTHKVTVGSDGGTEARPRNVALLYCIKY